MKHRKAASQRCSHCLQPLGVGGWIVELLRELGPLSVKQLAKKTGAKPRTVRAYLAALPRDRVHHIDMWEVRPPAPVTDTAAYSPLRKRPFAPVTVPGELAPTSDE